MKRDLLHPTLRPEIGKEGLTMLVLVPASSLPRLLPVPLPFLPSVFPARPRFRGEEPSPGPRGRSHGALFAESALHPWLQPPLHVFRSDPFFLRYSVQRPLSCSCDQENTRSQEHAPVHPRLMRCRPETVLDEERDLCRGYRDKHVDDQGNCCELREEADQKKESADDFNDADKRSAEGRDRDPDLYETANAERFR